MPSSRTPFFDAMAPEYDVMEPWYEHLYAELRLIVSQVLRPEATGVAPRALDAGCGTGLGAEWLAALGYRTHGVDLSAPLLAVAGARGFTALARADIEALPYADGVFAAVVSCGSVLSYVDDAGRALRELGRVLRPRGLLLLECEHRPSLDLVWAWLSGGLGDPLGYGLRPGQVWRGAITPRGRPCWMDYPGYGRLRLFTRRELYGLLLDAGLRPLRAWGLHWLTNLLPSTVLHRPRLGRLGLGMYGTLRAPDAALSASALAVGLANSLVVLATRDR